MKKKILSQMMILSFAFAGLFLVGNNVFGFDGYKKNEENLRNSSACQGQRGIQSTDANGRCMCLHDPEPGSGNTCGSADTIIDAPSR